MSDIAIRVENLSKMYRIGAREKQPQNGWQALQMLATSPFDYLRRMGRPPTEEETLWALKDVSFEVKRGEVVGIPSAPLRTSIGRNGAGTHAPHCVRCSAGESTLLKILSRITEPTKGRAAINGRVGSFLEACPEQRRRIGTGFHPELTGRENIHMNGAILGMRRGEIDRKFDETCPERSRRIVAFAEIEKFLDTPVKHYSSGMYVRLAFAVAAHRSAEFILRNGGLTASLEPEILLVDEVLAMGGVTFGRGQTLPWVVSKRRNNADKKKDEK